MSAELDRAREELAVGEMQSATAAALVAIAAALEVNIAETYIEGIKVGAGVTAEALGTVLGVVAPGGHIVPHDCPLDDPVPSKCEWPGHHQ